jgi:hypothetical protein
MLGALGRNAVSVVRGLIPANQQAFNSKSTAIRTPVMSVQILYIHAPTCFLIRSTFSLVCLAMKWNTKLEGSISHHQLLSSENSLTENTSGLESFHSLISC